MIHPAFIRTGCLRGYRAADLMSDVYEGSGHNERDRGSRMKVPLTFLLGAR
jgi:hypothetical protein